MRNYVDVLIKILQRGMKENIFTKAPTAPMAFAIFGMDNHICQWYQSGRGISPNDLAELYAGTALRIAGSEKITYRARLRRLTENALKTAWDY